MEVKLVVAKDKIIMEGYQAYWQGNSVLDNPYDEYLMHPQHELWEEGFYDGYDGYDEEWRDVH